MQLARLTGLTRASIALFESGSSNPGLDSLLKLSQGLQVSIDELISAPHAECLHIKAQDVPLSKKNKPGVTVRKLLPDKHPSSEIEELSLEPGATLTGTPHIEGTREYFTCYKGEVHIVVMGKTYQVQKGDVLSFPGEKPHAYRNLGSTSARGISIVFFSPTC